MSLVQSTADLINTALRRAGIEIRRVAQETPLFQRVGPFTLTSKERVAVICDTVEHVVRNGMDGAFVECGVWRGGSTMAAALMFLELGAGDRDLHLFDTFEGMPPPTAKDIEIATGKPGLHERNGVALTRAPLEDVRANMASTGYDMRHVHFHRGMVEDTIPDQAPQNIAILRLDTDWYASTKHELEHLWPHITPGGFLIIDDYGHFAGAKQAVDEFFGG